MGVIFRIPFSRPSVLCAIALSCCSGCYHPSEDNIRLRKINQKLNADLSQLTVETDAQKRTIAGLYARFPTIPTLPPQELAKLWVTSGIEFGNLTGGLYLVDVNKPGAAEGLQVFLTPTDEFGEKIQTAGSIAVEAFDLAEPKDNLLGRWTWDTISAKSRWRSFLFEFGYELNCPWQKPPKHSDITIRVVFTDELTHIPFTAEKMVHVEIPPGPTTAPATGGGVTK